MREHDFEPVPGLPESLPTGERILWQGSPNWRAIAISIFRIRLVVAWFALIALWRGLSQLGLVSNAEAMTFGLAILPVAVAAIAVLCLLAWLTARTTVYTITNRRVVMRYGIALPVTINVPFKAVASADLRVDSSGHGDIPLTLAGGDKFSYAMLWPHLKPWSFRVTQPMLRGVPDAVQVGGILSEACSNYHGMIGAPRSASVDDRPVASQRWEEVPS